MSHGYARALPRHHQLPRVVGDLGRQLAGSDDRIAALERTHEEVLASLSALREDDAAQRASHARLARAVTTLDAQTTDAVRACTAAHEEHVHRDLWGRLRWLATGR